MPAAILSSIESAFRLRTRFHPSHRLFSRRGLRNHSTVSLTILLGDSVFLVLISSNLVNRVPVRKRVAETTPSNTQLLIIFTTPWGLFPLLEALRFLTASEVISVAWHTSVNMHTIIYSKHLCAVSITSRALESVWLSPTADCCVESMRKNESVPASGISVNGLWVSGKSFLVSRRR